MRAPTLIALCWLLLLPLKTTAEEVYADRLTGAWANWSWNTRARNVSRPVRSGARSLAVKHRTAWAGLYLRREAALDAAAYASVRFWLHGGGHGGQTINVSLYDSANQASRHVQVTGRRGRWQSFDIAVAQFGPMADIAGLVWQDASGQAQPQFYLDSVELVAADDPPATSLDVTIDTSETNGVISPLIYGMSFADPALAEELALPLSRWGGNATSRYNFLNDTSNRASDWFFLNVPNDTHDVAALPDDSAADRFVENNLLAGAQSLLTLPMLGWVAKSRDGDCGFRISLYGAQAHTSPYRPDCGNGLEPGGAPITGNDLGSMTSRSPAETLRYHWDRIAVNPTGPRTAPPGFDTPPVD